MANAETGSVREDLPPPTGSNCEIRILQARFKKDGKKEIIARDGFEAERPSADEEYALVLSQSFDKKNVLEKTELRVNSAQLLKCFRDLVGAYPTVPSNFKTPFEMEAPFGMLFHYWGPLKELRDETKDDVLRMHLNLLLEFMRIEMGKDKEKHDSMLRKRHITFASLWTIYKPGDILYAEENGHSRLLVCEKTAYEETTRMGQFLEVHCSYTDYDGNNVGKAKHIFYVRQKQHFAAENPSAIAELPVYPRKFLPNQDRINELENELTRRGRRYLKFKGVQIKCYNGVAKWLKDPPAYFWHPDLADFPGFGSLILRIVIDRKTFHEETKQEAVAIQAEGDLDPMLCPPFAYGYSMARKEWCQFYIDLITEVPWAPDPFGALILKEEQKSLLAALTESHTFPDNARDETAQKGKGLVILLHGTPGSGKTLTAESAAEASKKALLSSSIGQLNKENRAHYFEDRLKKLLQYATIWKAIVLLDEADVFLEARGGTDGGAGDLTARNALVAVFLRHLEYFSGIVFLTSNRVGVFDDAMKSRIHLALEYAPPELSMRRLIWTQNLLAIPASESNLSLGLPSNINASAISAGINGEGDGETESSPLLDHLIRDKLNGREISNAVTTARTLARHREQKLELKHLEVVLKVRREFNASLVRIKKVREAEERAALEGSGVLGAHGLVGRRRNSLLVSADEVEGGERWLD
ncbi:P-loop containing nucleoside triphosphate hydrolase protein [Aulographum hederae CBS 113979]|uniref:P-loop containing nucleoside triphosphate hydrolase protein n=1 Tax=Aulographum hederae CBS 113979 TaxID=1176131 RepID=A0A6G1H8K1_9PEZI|nr:P-loop containing nucleoside triphosphate hydrolase protein [Aulographum hederae CBS 113979]